VASAFRFRLERLLEIRRAREEAAQRAHAEARRAVDDESRRLAALVEEEDAGRRASRDLRRGVLDLASLQIQEIVQNALERRIRTSRERLAELQRAELDMRLTLTEAMKAVKVLERVREKRLAEWTRARDVEERKTLDEVALGRAAGVREGA
jgi:flagellar FliJ protein